MTTAPDYLVFDGDSSNGINPYRPGVGDVGGAQWIDDQEAPPDRETMPYAAAVNQMAMLVVALAKVSGVVVMYVSNSGTPSIAGLRAAGTLLQASDFTVTPHGTGDTEITCPATKLVQPMACIAVTQKAGDFRASARLNGTGNGVRVETRGGSGLADSDFFLIWM